MSFSTNVKHSMRRRIYFASLVVAFIVASIIVNASVGMRNWSNITERQTRTSVHALLGKPDANFLPKGWEGWDRSGIVGAWVLIVYYDEADRVANVRQKFDWGLGHLFWDRD
jgi:hypothetical protein